MRGTRLGLLATALTAAAAIGLGGATASRAADDSDDEEPTQPAPTAAAKAGPPATFEAAARAASQVADLGTLLSPFSGKCDGEKRELDRLRCNTARAYLRQAIPRKSYWTVVDDPATLTVSDYDGSIKGYHVSVAGCLACTRPVTVGRDQDKRLITVKAPDKGAASLRAAVELSRNSVGFDSMGEAKTWLEQGRPELRTQFVFQIADNAWTYGTSNGYALGLVAMRVFNRCTGEVLISRPPSTGIADMPGIEEGCPRRRAGGDDATADATDRKAQPGIPTDMSKNDISQAMNTIRPQVFACFQKYKIPGLAQYEFEIAGNGTVHSVRLSGAFFGTPTGVCLLEAGQNARFPQFSRERQRFVYPFFLRQ